MKKILWNEQWKFTNMLTKSDPVSVTLPHDAMRSEPRESRMKNGSQTGFFPGGKYLYTKCFDVSQTMAEETVVLEFEGVYHKSAVYLNGSHVGGRPYGYSDFFVDLTGKLKVGENVIEVIADNTQQPNSRWYSGSGIYRDVYLHTAGKEYIVPSGIRVTTKSIHPTVVAVDTTFCGASDLQVEVVVSYGSETVACGTGAYVELSIPDAKLWDAEHPNLYDVKVALKRDDTVVDEFTERTGIRTLSWDAKEGFKVNGNVVKLRGGCVHHDLGPVGAASFKAGEVRRARIMKEAGFNAIRYAHNPAAKAFLDACDEVGIYVVDETFDTWIGSKSTYDYAMYFDQEHMKDLKDMIRMAYNHPCVVMYSIGNEMYMKPLKEQVLISNEMIDFCHQEDPTRPVTNAFNPATSILSGNRPKPGLRDKEADPCPKTKDDNPQGSLFMNMVLTVYPTLMKYFGTEKNMRKANGLMKNLDVVGLNYGDHLYEPQHQDYPNRILMGSETYPSAIGKNWPVIKKTPWLVGDFMWTGWDYLGESGVGLPSYTGKTPFTSPYPCMTAGCANIDLTGYIDAQGYYTAIVYGQYDKPYIAVHPVNHSDVDVFLGLWRFTDASHSWSWKDQEGKTAKVDVYAPGAEVELLLNGKSYGRKPLKECMASFEVPYQKGTLEAVNYDAAGKELARDVLHSAEEASELRILPEKDNIHADGMDLLYVPICITDKNGIEKYLEDREITVICEGAGELYGLCSGNPETVYPLDGNKCMTFHGRLLAVIRSNGKTGSITIHASSNDLSAKAVTVEAK